MTDLIRLSGFLDTLRARPCSDHADLLVQEAVETGGHFTRASDDAPGMFALELHGVTATAPVEDKVIAGWIGAAALTLRDAEDRAACDLAWARLIVGNVEKRVPEEALARACRIISTSTPDALERDRADALLADIERAA